jgi:hypothetical protein
MQMTKADGFAGWAGQDDVADLDLAVGDDAGPPTTRSTAAFA